MKQLNLLLLIIFFVAVQNSQAAENEPNDTKAQANTLSLNGSDNGTFNNSSDVDWWALTTTDGDLSISIAVLNCTITDQNCTGFRFTIYADDGTTIVGSGIQTSILLKGLIAGTYYVVVSNLYANEVGSTYSLYTNLITSTNDAEPNNNANEAIVLPLGGTKEGNVNYSNPLRRDSSDWYKVTTNEDGLLHFIYTASKNSVNLTLFDKNGTTQIAQSSNSTNGTFDKDGLAAGTYYVRVRCYSNSLYTPYTISDSLIKPEESNDNEPNDVKTQAIILSLNSTKEGHVGYYYNLKRDSADWYKITTNADGLLRFTFTAAATPVNLTLYDNNGTTQLAQSLNSMNGTLNKDGLAAGTYFIKLKCYNSGSFASYTLSDSLFTYNYTNDTEPNAKPYMAKTIPANGTTFGHVGFYYNNLYDSVDWYKINYTGSGALSFTINQEPYISTGSTTSMRFYVYKDTAASSIYSGASSAVTFTANLTGLSQGYYWIKIYSYNYTDHVSYAFSNSFTQVNVAKIKSSSYDTAAVCGSVNKIVFRCSGSNAPYTVQLYRYGILYGNALVTSKTATFKNLPIGSYYATVFGDGATGASFGKSKNVSLVPIPTDMSTTNITNKQAELNWAMISCASYYSIQYKMHDSADWTTKKTIGNLNNYLLKGLAPATTYDWRIAALDSANGITASGVYTDSVTFTTATLLIAEFNNASKNVNGDINSKNNIGVVSVFPNPAHNYFIIKLKNSSAHKANAMLFDITGKQVWTSGLINAEILNGKKVSVNEYQDGVYYLKITDDKGNELSVSKLVISK